MLEDLGGEYLLACRRTFGRWFDSGASGNTLLLGRSTISSLMRTKDWLDAAAEGFAAMADDRAQSPMPMAIDGVGGTFHAKAANLRLDRTWVALKLNGNFPDNRTEYGLPTIQGGILLCDAENGQLLAILDSIEVTLRRTAGATALAARYLARPDSETILICGCGDQAAAQEEALCDVLPLRAGHSWDRDAERARAFARRSRIPMTATDDLASVSRLSDVIVTCTTAGSAFLSADMVRPGTFVAAVGADSPHKSEIDPALMASALVVCDVTDQCERMGDLRQAIAAGSMARRDVHAELADLVAGTRPGRGSPEQITLFDSTGTAVQDVAASAMIYRRAVEASSGRAIDLAS